MDEAARVIERLARIESLRTNGPRAGRPAPELLAELRALVPEAEVWARTERDTRAPVAATKVRTEAEGMS